MTTRFASSFCLTLSYLYYGLSLARDDGPIVKHEPLFSRGLNPSASATLQDKCNRANYFQVGPIFKGSGRSGSNFGPELDHGITMRANNHLAPR
jgi:hypothetical protein